MFQKNLLQPINAGRLTNKFKPLIVLLLLSVSSSSFLFAAPKSLDDAIHDKSVELDFSIPFEPINKRDKKTEMKVEALSFFMTARLKKTRNDFLGALADYEKAVEIDPNSLAIYSELIPLAFALNRIDQAVKYALKAIELDPNDHRLLQKLGLHMIKKQKYSDAIKFFEKALQSNQLKKNSITTISIHRDLAVLYAATGAINKSAEAYEVVFKALDGSGDIKLDYHTKSRLLSDPQTSYERMGQVFLLAKKTDLAIKAFEYAAKSSKGKPGNKIINLANIYYETGKPEKALKELDSYLDRKLTSRGRFAYELLTKVLVKLKKENELIPKLEKAASVDTRNYDLAYFLADQYVKANKLDDAKKLIEETLSSSGKSEGHISLASIYRLQKKPWELLDSMAKSFKGARQLERLENELKLVQDDKELLQSILTVGLKKISGDKQEADFEHAILLAKLAVSLKKSDAVKKFYRYCLKVRRKNATTIFNELGQYFLDEKLYSDAEKVFQEAIDDSALSNGKPHFLFQVSQAKELQGKTEEALTAIQQAKLLRPNNPVYSFQESWIYSHGKQWDQAIKILETIISAHTDKKLIVRRCKLSISNIYVQKGDMPKGEKVLEEVIKDDPNDPGVNNDLGYLYADQGKNLEKAKTMIKIAIDSDPENPAYLDSMGWVLYRLGDFKEAVVFLKKASEHPNGGDSTIFDHLGDCYIKLKNKTEASKAWNSAIQHARKQSDPDQDKIQKIQAKIDSNK